MVREKRKENGKSEKGKDRKREIERMYTNLTYQFQRSDKVACRLAVTMTAVHTRKKGGDHQSE